MTLARHLEQLRNQRITFDEFARATRSDWRTLAQYMLHKWRAPSAIEPEDVEQELLTGCWSALDRYDPERIGFDGKPVSLRRYAVFHAVTHAKRWLHRQRGATRDGDGEPSRFPVCERDLPGVPGGTALPLEELLVTESLLPPEQFDRAAYAEALRKALDRCKDWREALCVEALARTENYEAAVDVVYENLIARRLCGFKNRRAAHRAIKRACEAVGTVRAA